jgi:hypothetical protein
VIPLKKILGRYLATRATTQGALAHVLDSFGKLLIAELPVHGTLFVGKRLAEARIREQTGLAVVGVWGRGSFAIPDRDTVLADDTVMVVVGTREHLEALETLTGEKAEEDLVLIIGHGRIGCSAATLSRQPSGPLHPRRSGGQPRLHRAYRRHRRCHQPDHSRGSGHRSGQGTDRHHQRRWGEHLLHPRLPPPQSPHSHRRPRQP